jgi:thioredoxin reductase (NADPH)
MADESYELVIIGGGPAGLTAGIYASRSRLDCVLLEANPLVGGQAALTDLIENYPGFDEPIKGFDLMEKMRKQAEKFGLKIKNEPVIRVERTGDGFVVHTNKGKYPTEAIIMATGSESRNLGVPGEQELRGGGVTYCATCDGPLYKEMDVAVVGGGDSAVGEALYLTRFAAKVYLIHRRDRFRADAILSEQAVADDKIEILWDTVVTAIHGKGEVQHLHLKNVKTSEESTLEVDGVFIYVGVNPNTEFVKGLLKLDNRGFIMTDDRLEASVPGIFAAGDCRSKALKQVATAVGEGATAAFVANEYIQGRRHKRAETKSLGYDQM